MSDAIENEMHWAWYASRIDADRGKLYAGFNATKVPKSVTMLLMKSIWLQRQITELPRGRFINCYCKLY
jgi:hypothetical protein